MLRYTPYVLAIILLLSLSDCRKSHDTPPLDFSYSGTLHEGYLITFHCNTAAGGYLWDFGDGSRSTDPAPNHTYSNPGSFTVTLTINNDPTKKITKVISIEPPFDFTYSGDPAAGHQLNFSTNVPSGNRFLWSFGDGTASTEAAPKHTFATNDIFNVSLVVNGDTDHAVRKAVNIFANGIYLSLIPGTRTWHHIYTDAVPWPPYHTAHTMNDTVMTVAFIPPSQMAIGGDTLVYYNSTSSDSVLVFNHYIPYSANSTTLSFNHFTGQINYDKSIHISAGAGNADDNYYAP